jgi:hypothetical protein
MKQTLKVYSTLLLALFFIQVNLYAEEPLVEKKKTYSKSYTISNSDVISLSNQFGEMRVNSWDRNEVKVDVTITAKAISDERAQEILDNISIEDGREGSGVYFKTKWKNDKHNNNHNKNKNNNEEKYKDEGMTINYVVYLPSRNPVNISNQFGATIVPDLSGETKINSQFGSLNAGNLSNVKSVSIQFGHGTIESANNGKLDFQFNNKDIIVRKLSGDVTVNVQHCKSHSVKMNVDNSIKSISLNNSFSDVILSVPNNLSASYTISTSHGGFTNKSSFNISEEDEDKDSNRYGPRFNHKYTGNSGGGASKIKVATSFGDVIIAHSMDVKVEAKSSKVKEKKKTTVI